MEEDGENPAGKREVVGDKEGCSDCGMLNADVLEGTSRRDDEDVRDVDMASFKSSWIDICGQSATGLLST